jgi:hypothetical protein
MPITQYGLGSLSNSFNPTNNNGFGFTSINQTR